MKTILLVSFFFFSLSQNTWQDHLGGRKVYFLCSMGDGTWWLGLLLWWSKLVLLSVLFCFIFLHIPESKEIKSERWRKLWPSMPGSNTLPPARLQLLKVPQLLRTAPPSGDQVNTHMSLGETFYVQTITKGSRCLSSLPFPEVAQKGTDGLWAAFHTS